MKRYGFDIKPPVSGKKYAIMDSNLDTLFHECTYQEHRHGKGKPLQKYFEGHGGHTCDLKNVLWWVPQHRVNNLVLTSRNTLSEILDGNT